MTRCSHSTGPKTSTPAECASTRPICSRTSPTGSSAARCSAPPRPSPPRAAGMRDSPPVPPQRGHSSLRRCWAQQPCAAAGVRAERPRLAPAAPGRLPPDRSPEDADGAHGQACGAEGVGLGPPQTPAGAVACARRPGRAAPPWRPPQAISARRDGCCHTTAPSRIAAVSIDPPGIGKVPGRAARGRTRRRWVERRWDPRSPPTPPVAFARSAHWQGRGSRGATIAAGERFRVGAAAVRMAA